MKLTEYAEIIQADLIVRFSPDCTAKAGRWLADFEHSECKEEVGDGMLCGGCGYGKTPDEAIANYCLHLNQYKVIVFNAGSEKRIEFGIPKNLEAK
jgi:hypothetical protein